MRVLFSLVLVLCVAGAAAGQTANDPAAPQAGSDAHELAKKLSNPVASLISVPFQSNFDFGMGTGSGWRYQLNFQPVIPIRLNSKWNLISRTIVPIIHQHNVANVGTRSGLGDITQSLFFSRADSKRFVWAVGPALLIPICKVQFCAGRADASNWSAGVSAGRGTSLPWVSNTGSDLCRAYTRA